MAWMQTLAETYDTYANLAGVERNGQPVLLPISHSTLKAQIEITIDENAEVYDAKVVESEDIIIPATEDSAAKTNGKTPCPLCDKLCYLAGDYSKYTEESKEEYYNAYMRQLKTWVESEYSHPMIELIFQYLEKGILIEDLVKKKILQLDSSGRLKKNYKIQKQEQTQANVRFIVYTKHREDESRVWKNHELYQLFIQFYHSLKEDRENKDLCYVSGTVGLCTEKHPAKIIGSKRAKLISTPSNQSDVLGYLGRFTDKRQVVSVGYETSQKAHNALRWLLQKQGDTRDDSAIVCWMINRNDMPLPDISKDSVNAYSEVGEMISNILLSIKNETNHDTGVHFAKQFRNAIQGYTAKIQQDDRIAVISLDAATDGRISITYYDEMGGKQYIDAVRNWQEHCSWERYIVLGDTENKKYILLNSSPAPREIALAAFGVQRQGKGYLEADSKLIKETKKRLLPCITKRGIRIPNDIIKAAAIRASQPQTMDDFVWENQVLSVVCAMIRYRYEQEKGDKTMSTFLEDNQNDRNVLFGRLLATCDYMERRAMYEKGDDGKPKEQRATNAKRYWNAYSRKPATTFKIIRENLNVYENKLSFHERQYFCDRIDEITGILSDAGFDNRALTELYLPGYSLEMQVMKEYFKNYNKENN